MLRLTPGQSAKDIDPAAMKKLGALKRASLAMAASIAAVVLAGWLVPPLDSIFPHGWQLMRAETAFLVLLNVLSIALSEPRLRSTAHRIATLLAGFNALVATLILAEYGFHSPLGVAWLLPFDVSHTIPNLNRMSPQTALGLALLGCATLLIRARNPVAARTVDVLIFCLGLLDLVLISGYAFNAMLMFGLSMTILTSPLTLACLFLLTMVLCIRRADNSVLSIFLSRGIAGRIARGLAPVLLLLPFLREIGRARLVQAHLIPEQYTSAILASVATALSFILLLMLAWHVHRMEKEIHDLSLRDELTGLYNLRGFHLLAEQALRLARRSRTPFSVLFIDLDNLKSINDLHGHDAGSQTLAETAELLQATFRETDVIARIGGDEFAVAGQFSHPDIAFATERLREASTLRNARPGNRFALSFSVGHVTTASTQKDSLKALLSQADEAMYEEKRRRKTGVPRSQTLASQRLVTDRRELDPRR